MTAAEDRARELAAERYPAYPCADAIDHRSREAFVVGYVTGRTITAEQVEAAAEGMFFWDIEEHPEPKPTWEMLTEEQKGIWRSGACAAFEAAGFIVEGGE